MNFCAIRVNSRLNFLSVVQPQPGPRSCVICNSFASATIFRFDNALFASTPFAPDKRPTKNGA